MPHPAPRVPRFTRALTILTTCAALVGSAACTGGSPETAATGTTSTAGSSTAGPSTETSPSATVPTIVATPALGSVDVAPAQPLTLSSADGRLTSVTVTGPDGAVAGSLTADGRSWTADIPFAYDARYEVSAVASGAAGTEARVAGTISTVTPRTLTYASAIPNPDLTDVGVGQPVALYFDEAVTDRAAVEKALHVTSTPAAQGAWHWMSDTEVHFRPEHFWSAGAHVTVDVDIYGVDVGDDIYGQEDRHLEFDVHDEMTATVSTDDLQLRAYRNGQLVKTMPVSLGKPGHETPSGTYVVMEQDADYTMDSSTYGVPIEGPDGYVTDVQFASRLSNSGIFVHAAPWSVPDQGVDNVSHGCLNVSTDDAEWFFQNFGRGDVVQVQGTGVPLEATDGFGDWNLTWADWTAGSAL